MDIDDVIQKKTKEKRNPDRILFTFKTQQSAKNTSFLQNESTNIKKQRARMPFFWSKSQSSHTNIHFICKIVQEANF